MAEPNSEGNLYTTGELAKLCGVTVRTVQYYDTRNILVPSALSEGGRRLYSEDDLRKMHIICFLRDAGLSISNIGALFEEEDPGSVISVLVEEQERILLAEQEECQKKLDSLGQIRRGVKLVENFSVDSIADIAYITKHRKKMTHIHAVMVAGGVTVDVVETVLLYLGIFRGIWWPYLLGLPLLLASTFWICWFYFRQTGYICPKCHAIFKPRFWEMLFAKHTVTTRKLSCTECGSKNFCVETYQKERTNHE